MFAASSKAKMQRECLCWEQGREISENLFSFYSTKDKNMDQHEVGVESDAFL